jgi:site-specific DNA-methyltransferase (adenine-specific)/adenine-specific DNA-methyltransferase
VPTLNWIGKAAVEKHHKDVPYRLLELVPELSCGDTQSGNLIVQGDNLHALKGLLPRYAGKVKCIYIDPPYNTGNEGWVYCDNVNSPEIRQWLNSVVGKEGETLDRHDRWLCMMYPRLLLLREFLRDDGVIFVSIDDNEQANLKLLMDEIFGARNFINNIIWQKKYSPQNDAKHLSDNHDFLICYAKNKSIWRPHLLPRTEKQDKAYKNPDKDSRGLWKASDLTRAEHRNRDFYGIITPTGKTVYPANGRSWSRPPEEIERLREDNRLWFGTKGDAIPSLKRFLSDVKDGITALTIWTYEEVGHNQIGKQELKNIFSNSVSIFDTPKPTQLIERVLQLSTDKDSIILDSFAGSGTTAHAVLNLNKQDGGNRQFILVEMDETIATTVTAERNKRVIEGYDNAKGEPVEGLGGGFQFCRLSKEPLFTADGQVRPDVTFAQLAEFVWFKETGTGFTGCADSPLLGVFNNNAVYLLYNGILGDSDPEKGNVLTPSIYKTLPPFQGRKIIYATACRGGDSWLNREQIVLKQTPYELTI